MERLCIDPADKRLSPGQRVALENIRKTLSQPPCKPPVAMVEALAEAIDAL